MLSVNAIHKKFELSKKERKLKGTRTLDVLRGVSFECLPGTVTGLLGVNGAGKTTTLRTLTGAIRPDEGGVTLASKNIHKDKSAALKLGFHSGSTALYKRLTVDENLRFFSGLYGMVGEALERRITQLAEELRFSDYRSKKIKDLSTGMLQKVAIARAILHNPEVIVLDEPTTGLDVMASAIIIDFIRKQKDAGKTILFSTHNMHEVESLCDSIVVLHNGVVHFNGGLQEFCNGKELSETITETLSA